jgi:hypothetical protein
MAKNKIEGTEEETPKTRKDIRQERRQMRAINAGRQEMGGEKLYTKKEIRDVNKPFEPKPSDVLTGTKQGVGNSSTTYNDPNAPSEKEYEYKAYNPGGYSSKAKPMSKEEYEEKRKTKTLGYAKYYQDYDDYLKSIQEQKTIPSSETEKENITKEQFVALNADDPNTGDAVKKVLVNNIVSDNTTSLQEKQKLIDATNVAKTEVNKTDQQINDQAKQEVTNTTTPISTTDPNAPALGGSGASVVEVMDKAPAGPEWTSVVPTGQQYQAPSREEIYEQARQAKSKAPSLVVEKLGLQDYYPEAGRNIAVGTFTGSRIGSQTIYSGAGGLLPLGLYDARKRAIATEIKKKEAIMDQLKEMPDIAKQFKPYFSEKYMDFLSPWMDAFKDKPEELMRNTDFLKGVRQYQAIGENFLKVDADLKEFEALINPGDKGAEKGGYGAYATPAMLEILHKFKAGMLPGKIEEYFDGSKNISDLTKTIQAIPNGYKIIGDQMKVLLANDQVERVIKPKEGEEVDWTKAKQEIDDIAQQVKDGSSDYESYLTVVKKYYDIDTRSLAEQFVKGNSLNALTDKEEEEYINSLTLFADAQIPEASMIAKVDRQNNDNASRYAADVAARTAASRLAFDKEQAKFDRENSQTLKDVQGLLSSDKTTSRVQHKGVETSGNGLEYNYHVIMDGTNATKRYTGAQIIALQKQGRTFTGNDGKAFNVPESVTIQPYETIYTKSGNRVIGRTRINAYTAGGTEEDPTSTMVNSIIELPDQEYTNADGSSKTDAMTRSDVYNYNKSPERAAMGTEGGKTSTTNVSYKRGL